MMNRMKIFLVYFRVTIHVLNLKYEAELNRTDDPKFHDASARLTESIEKIFDEIPGEQYATVIKIE